MSEVDLSKAVRVELEREEKFMQRCMKSEGFVYRIFPQDQNVFGLWNRSPKERLQVAKENGYGVTRMMMRLRRPLLQEQGAQYSEAIRNCFDRKPPRKVIELLKKDSKKTEEEIARMQSDVSWRKADQLWKLCMNEQGFSKLEGSSFGIVRTLQSKFDTAPDDETARDDYFAGTLREEISVALADDKCRRSSLDKVEPLLMSKITERKLDRNPKLGELAVEALKNSGS